LQPVHQPVADLRHRRRRRLIENASGKARPRDGLFHLRTGKTQALVYHSKKSFAYRSMKFAIALFDPPHSPAARRALRFSEAALA
ncbi:hypothetical protein, partial [Salmonella sp. SAL04281]|uniref:hypothetical protein n=1 Tax=Salmonella sp. SAL04281 TaxID=3159859 RepID=UPI003977FE5E